MPHHGSHALDILGLQQGLQLGEFVYEEIHLVKKDVLIGHEQLAPHEIVDPRDAGQIAEGVAREFFHVLLVVAGHEGDGDAVGQLGEEADHLVVLLGGEGGDVGKAQKSAQLDTGEDGLGGVLFGGGDDVVGSDEHFVGAVLHPRHLPSCHGVGGDELHVGAQHFLNAVHDAPLDTRHVGEEGSALEEVLVLFDPLHENVGVEGEDHQIRLPDHTGVRLGGALINEPLADGVVDGALLQGDGADMEPEAAERLGVAAAQQSQTYNEYFLAYVYDHDSSTSAPSLVMSPKKPG